MSGESLLPTHGWPSSHCVLTWRERQESSLGSPKRALIPFMRTVLSSSNGFAKSQFLISSHWASIYEFVWRTHSVCNLPSLNLQGRKKNCKWGRKFSERSPDTCQFLKVINYPEEQGEDIFHSLPSQFWRGGHAFRICQT